MDHGLATEQSYPFVNFRGLFFMSWNQPKGKKSFLENVLLNNPSKVKNLEYWDVGIHIFPFLQILFQIPFDMTNLQRQQSI